MGNTSSSLDVGATVSTNNGLLYDPFTSVHSCQDMQEGERAKAQLSLGYQETLSSLQDSLPPNTEITFLASKVRVINFLRFVIQCSMKHPRELGKTEQTDA